MMLLQKRLKPSCNIPRQTPQILGHSRDLYAWQDPFTRNAMLKKNTYHVALHCNHCYSCFHIDSQERFKVCKIKYLLLHYVTLMLSQDPLQATHWEYQTPI